MPRFLIRAAVLASAFLLSANLHAQTGARPGSSARGTTGTGARSLGTSSTGTSRASGPRQYRSNTELGDATIQIDPETRSLVIVTDDDTHNELMKVIKTLDQPKPQVLIKVVFLEVTYNKDSDIGVEGNYTFKNQTGTGAVTGNTTTTSTVGTTGNQTVTTRATDLSAAALAANVFNAGSNFGLASLTDGTFVRLVTDDWSATIRALATKGKVELLSRPSIMARNNQEAVIVVGSEVPFITNSRTDALGNIINTITYDNIGIILRVTPFITSEGTVEMIVAPEISSLTDRTVPISSNASAPVIDKRSAETVVVTPNAKTVVIGGLMSTQRIESIRKVPILGDIPYLGLPFRRTIKSDVKKELIIFLTPYIVNTPESLQRVTAGELSKTELVEKSFTKKDFDKYLDDPSLFPETDPSVDLTPVKQTTVVKTQTRTKVTSAPAEAKPVVPPKPKSSSGRPSNPKGFGR
jgi:general secretion pathway protein D